MNSNKMKNDISRNEDEIDIRAVLDILIKNWVMIGAVTLVFALCGGLYALIAKPIYLVDIAVQVEDSTDLAGAMGGGSLIGGLSSLFDVKSTDDGEMQILDSRLVTASVVENLKMYIDATPKYFPLIGHFIAERNNSLSRPGVLGFGGYAWGSEKIVVDQFEVPTDFEEDVFKVIALGGNRYRLTGSDLDADATGRVGEPLTLKSRSGDITLLVSDLDGVDKTEFEIRRFSKLQVLDKLQKDLTITEMGKDQSGVIGVTYENPNPVLAAAVLNQIAENYVHQNADRKAATAEKSLVFLNAQLPDVEHTLRDVEDRLNAYQNRHEVVDLSEQAKAVLGQSVDAQASLFQLEQKRKELATRYSELYPDVVALDQQILAARDHANSVNESIRRLPDAQQNVVRLRRDVTVETNLYVGLLNSIQQLRLATASKLGNVRVIDHAVIPDKSVKPKRLLVLALATVVGLLAGMSVAAVRATLFGGITDPMDIERETSLDVIATIPLSSEQRELTRLSQRNDRRTSALLALARPQEPTVEAVRSLCTALQFALLERPTSNVVLMTGPSVGIGKSFVTANLAALMGLSKKRVLLIDADLRRGHLATDLGVQARKGLADVLRDATPLNETIVVGVSPSVDFLPAGSLLAQPVELLSGGGMSRLIHEVSGRYDLVLLDAPPVLPVTDATLFAPLAGIVLLMARSGITTTGELLESVRRIERVGASVMGVVFNGFRPGLRSAQYGNYGGYVYLSNAKEVIKENS